MVSVDLKPEVKEAIQKAVLSYPERWTYDIGGGYVAAYLTLDRNTGEETDTAPAKGAGCHYGFQALYDGEIAVNGHKPLHHGAHPEYTRWVCRESPFAHGVLNRDNDEEILNHASVLDSLLLGNGGCLWVGKALRYTTEDKFRLPFWYKLREEGLNGLQAFIGCSILASDGSPASHTTHNSLVSYGSPDRLRRIYEELKGLKKIEGTQAARSGGGGNNWGSLKGKKVKKSDGWGGFVEVDSPSDAKEFAAQLKEIFEGDPKNVG